VQPRAHLGDHAGQHVIRVGVGQFDADDRTHDVFCVAHEP
jgi:hypothetical protein